MNELPEWRQYQEGDDREALRKLAEEAGTDGESKTVPGVWLFRSQTRDPRFRAAIAQQEREGGCCG